MDVKNRRIAELKPAEYNPRRITTEQFQDLVESFQNLGTLEPAVINTYPGRENIIISGHQRVKVAEKLGMKEYPCLMVSFPPEKEREANIRMNKNGGEWDFDRLASEFEMEDLVDWGFDAKEFGIGVPEILDEISLPDQERSELEDMTFTVTADQAEQIRKAVTTAKDMGPFVDTGNENSNGNALARIAETFLGTHGNR